MSFSLLLRSSSRTVASRRTAAALSRSSLLPQRRMGSDMPTPQSSKARLWEGHPTKPEGWETTIYVTYGAAAVLIVLALGFAPETSIQTWARAEAKARLELDPDEKLVFGVHYSSPERQLDFESKKPDNPFDEDDDDDDDDDDEEDDEEEEEEE